MIAPLAARVWLRLRGTLQWRLLYLVNPRFGVGVSGVIRDDDGRVLLLRHRFHAEGWALPGGWMKRGETCEGAVAREVREETGYEVEVDALVRLTSGFRLRVEMCFAGRLVGGGQRLDRREVLEARFFAVDRLPDDLLERHRTFIEETSC